MHCSRHHPEWVKWVKRMQDEKKKKQNNISMKSSHSFVDESKIDCIQCASWWQKYLLRRKQKCFLHWKRFICAKWTNVSDIWIGNAIEISKQRTAWRKQQIISAGLVYSQSKVLLRTPIVNCNSIQLKMHVWFGIRSVRTNSNTIYFTQY